MVLGYFFLVNLLNIKFSFAIPILNEPVFNVVNKGYINKELSMYLMNAYEIKEIIVFFNLTQIIRIILVPSD